MRTSSAIVQGGNSAAPGSRSIDEFVRTDKGPGNTPQEIITGVKADKGFLGFVRDGLRRWGWGGVIRCGDWGPGGPARTRVIISWGCVDCPAIAETIDSPDLIGSAFPESW